MGDLELWLVNDDPAQLLVQKRLLGRFAATVWDFQSPTELMTQARKFGSCPNLVSDFHMPGMNGLELSQLWCQMHPNARILLLSASPLTTSEQEEAKYLPSNRVRVLAGFRIPELLNVAKEWFARDSKPGEDSSDLEAVQPSAQLEYFDTSVHEKLKILGGQPFLEKTLQRFAEKVPYRFQVMEEAILAAEFSDLHHQAHSLKGSCGVAGATVLLEAADKLELAAIEPSTLKLLEAHLEELKNVWASTEKELRGHRPLRFFCSWYHPSSRYRKRRRSQGCHGVCRDGSSIHQSQRGTGRGQRQRSSSTCRGRRL